jgi:cbb3-type cytochrome oxidase subunit 3
MRLSELVAGLTPATFNEIALVLFVLVFIGALIHVARRKNRTMFAAASELPLVDDAAPRRGDRS